jgi:2,4-dienoyl-CoA reductase-like NADH-dependent reductase (Old Yellow Enzyme family)
VLHDACRLPPDADLQPLWQPLELRGVTLPNRLMCTATTLQYGRDGLISDRHLAFYRERARGGVGLLFSEQLAASPLSDTAFPRSIRAYDERQVERFRALAAALEPHETRFFAQLVAGGAKGDSTGGLDGWGPLRGPSRVATPDGEPPLPLDEADLAQLAADHARSAAIIQAGGLDGVEVHGAHGWLVGQFLSPFYNRRDDGYGGPVENRCRLALELGRAIRAEVGEAFPVGIAVTYDEGIGEAGITPADTERQLEVLASAGVFDFFDLSIGAPHSGHLTISPMSVPEGYALPFGLRAKRVVGDRAAVFVAGRVVSVAMAAQAVAAGAADVVGMTRAHLADPHLVRKAREGRADETTRCVGANVCVGRALRGVEVACVLNPITGREAYWGEGSLEPTASPKQVVVLGAGPAGLRAAATAAARGHGVTVHEREMEPGGHLRDLGWLPTRSAWLNAVEDLVAAVERHGGELRLSSAPGPEALAAAAPDVVLVATGAGWDASGRSSRRPDRAGLPGAALDLGTALDRCRQDARALGGRVLIVDEAGTYPPLGLAEALAEAGVEVELATPAASVGWRAAEQLELPHVLPRLLQLGVRLTPSFEVGSISVRAVDTVVLAMERVPRDELVSPLRAALPDVRAIGDARAPRTTIAVIHEAEEVARAL